MLVRALSSRERLTSRLAQLLCVPRVSAVSPAGAADIAARARDTRGGQNVDMACERDSACASRGWVRTFARRLRTVVDRPQTGLNLGPSAVSQRPALIHASGAAIWSASDHGALDTSLENGWNT